MPVFLLYYSDDVPNDHYSRFESYRTLGTYRPIGLEMTVNHFCTVSPIALDRCLPQVISAIKQSSSIESRALSDRGYRIVSMYCQGVFTSAYKERYSSFRPPEIRQIGRNTTILLKGVLHIMQKVVINENERGLLFINGRFTKVLNAGKYYVFGGREIEVVSLEDEISSKKCSLEILLESDQIKEQAAVVEIGDDQLALHYIDGHFSNALQRGKHAYWNAASRHEFRLVDISKPQVDDDIPLSLFSMLPVHLYTRIEVLAHEKARLYFDSKLQGVLEPGVYYFWRCGVKVQVSCVDTRLTQLNVCGQEIMSQDKVALRINFVCNYKITDFVKISTEIDDYKEQIHNAAQLALRDYVGRYKLDDILLNKNEMTQFVLSKLKEKESELYVKFYDAGVKDIILPGEIRSIMNTVLVAEKKAQASVITRREEVASTRSLLNTAKLMDENATLYKLKELEYLERICENVGSINLNGSGDVINQLAALITKK